METVGLGPASASSYPRQGVWGSLFLLPHPPGVELHLCGGEGPLWSWWWWWRRRGRGREREREERDATELVSVVGLRGVGRRRGGGTLGGDPGGCIVNLPEREGEGYCQFEPFLCEKLLWDLTAARCSCAHFTDVQHQLLNALGKTDPGFHNI